MAVARPMARSTSSRCAQPRRTRLTPAAAASNFSVWASEPSPSTTRGRPVPAAATAGMRSRAPLFSSSLPTKSRKRSGRGKDGAAEAIALVSAASTTFGSTSTRGMPAATSSEAMAWLTARVAPARARAARFSARSACM